MDIVLILVGERGQTATKVQNILTHHANIIRTRLGINRQLGMGEEGTGFIFLELCGTDQQAQELVNELNAIGDVNAQYLKMELGDCSCPGCQG